MIRTIDDKQIINVDQSMMIALYSTIVVNLPKSLKTIDCFMAFLKNGKASNKDALKIAKNVNQLRDMLSAFDVSKVVFNFQNKDECPPWGKNISPTITSCSNYFFTSDGKELLVELVALFTYSYYYKCDVEIL